MQEVNIEESTNKKVNIVYDSIHTHRDADRYDSQILSRGLQDNPKWWKELTPFAEGRNNFNDVLNNLNHADMDCINTGGTLATSKRCPGMVNHLRQSLVLRTPHDIVIKTGNGPDEVAFASPLHIVGTSTHSSSQTGSAPFHVVKFMFPYHFTTDIPTTATMVDPIFYNDLGYRICPGVSRVDPRYVFTFNIICLLPRVENVYHIHKGDVIALLQLGHPIGTLERKDLSKLGADTDMELRSTVLNDISVYRT
jgi:hypothetical protein